MRKKLMMSFAMLWMFIGVAVAQITSVIGTVVEEDGGEPVVGATVLIKGTTKGVVTDVDGKFTLNDIPADAKTVVISFVGLATAELPVQASMMVKLKHDANELDEVIITAFGTSTKGTFTGSASVMKSDQIEKRQVSNISNALAGAVAGVQIQSDNGQPGSSAKVRIRGVGSINASMEPLYVVDGIPYDGDLSSINAADIESMTVLKDAASTALYGARGANGIIMITTKQGKSGRTSVNFDAKAGINTRAIKNYNVMTDPKAYVENAYQAIYNAGLYNLGYSADEAYAYANGKLHGNTDGGIGYQVFTTPLGEQMIGRDGKLNPNAELGYSDGTYYYTPDSWEDETFQNNMRQEYNLTMSGTGEKSTFYFSLGYLDDKGIISGSGFTRYSGRFKGDYQLKKWLKVGANVNYINSTSRSPGEQTTTNSSGNAFFIANTIAPIYPMYVRDADTRQVLKNAGRDVYDYGEGKSSNFSRPFMSIANPAGDLIYNKEEYLKDIINTNWFADITPLTGLKLTARYGLNIDNTRYNELRNAYMGQSAELGGRAYQAQTRTYGFNQQYLGNYQISFADEHHIDITAGYDGYTYNYANIYASGQNLYNPESFYVSNSINNKNGGGRADNYSTIGVLARVNYSYADTYFANASFRRDASSRFAPGNRWGNFWSASGGWMLNREAFLSDVTWINLLKLKASFGQQGNDNVGNYYAYMDQYTVTGAEGVFSDATLAYKGNIDLTWETSTSYNVGVDFNLLGNKLSGSIEYFGRISKDMLYNKPVAASLGYTSIPMNIGSMTNSGLEIDLNWEALRVKEIVWSFNLNSTLIKNTINELHPDLGGKWIDGTRLYEEGHSMYRMWLVEYAGVDEETGLAQYWAVNDKGERYKTDNYSIAENYKVATDDLMPTVYGGFGTTISAYGFDAAIQCSYQLGGKIFDSGYQRLMHSGTSSAAGQNWHTDIAQAWTPENRATNVPRLSANDRFASSTSTRFLVSSNYLSINNITVGYTLPKNALAKLAIERLRVYMSADNLGLLAARKGLDPRQSYISSTTARYTPIRTISGGLNLTF
ncbi:MAG: SusC/RagA family TonB-linked outer membrane protein [Bacteroidales bacterium]